MKMGWQRGVEGWDGSAAQGNFVAKPENLSLLSLTPRAHTVGETWLLHTTYNSLYALARVHTHPHTNTHGGGEVIKTTTKRTTQKNRHFVGNKMDSLLEDACVSHFGFIDGRDKVNDERKAWPLVCEDASWLNIWVSRERKGVQHPTFFLLFSFSLSLGPQSLKWCHPQWVKLSQARLRWALLTPRSFFSQSCKYQDAHSRRAGE